MKIRQVFSRRKAHTKKKKNRAEIFSSQEAKCLYILLVAFVLMVAVLFLAVTPQRYDLQVGDIAPVTITASKDVVDELSTAKQRDIAARAVEPIYVHKSEVTPAVLANATAVLKQVKLVQQYGLTLCEQYEATAEDKKKPYAFSSENLQYAQSLLTELTLTDYQVITVLRMTDEQMAGLQQNLSSALENTLNTAVREGYLNESIQYLQQIIGYKTEINILQNVVTPILRKVIEPNMVIDQEATAELQEEARIAVEPVIYKQGQNIVLARERITADQVAMLSSLGLLDNASVDINMYIGGVMLTLLCLAILYLLLILLDEKSVRQPKRMAIIAIILFITLLFCVLSRAATPYLAPTLLATMMITSLLGIRAAMASCMSISVLVGVLAVGGDGTLGVETVNLVFTTFISGVCSVMIIRDKPYRQQILLCGIVSAVINFITILSIGAMTSTALMDITINGLWSAGSAVLASVLCIALDPLLESSFHLATPVKLLELSNPNHPLLRRLLIEAPGTYHHSIIVANLAEAAAEAVGARALLARVSAYFHDIGKLKRPQYFKENQMGENPHDKVNPYVSAAIVTAHVRDGLMMAQQAHLPQEICDIILEHHGNTPVMYFYAEATKQADGQPVDIADFRYDGRRPQSKEAAIVMLADTVEAAVRTLPDPTPSTMEAFIAKLVNSKVDDGQLSEAPLTLGDISLICKSFFAVMNGVFHERIEYPAVSPVAKARMEESEAKNIKMHVKVNTPTEGEENEN